MIKICFVCLGNICRSPMAEFMMKKKLIDLNLNQEFLITSRATSNEEEGNDIYPPAKEKLSKESIPYVPHKSTPIKKDDYTTYDYFICMEDKNIRNLLQIFGNDPENKVIKLLNVTNKPKDIADPWYTGDFDKTYEELDFGLDELIRVITKK